MKGWIGRTDRKSGFTLIEMLIVIIILGILAMIIIPQLGVTTDDAKTNTLQANLSSIRSAVEVYYAQPQFLKLFAVANRMVRGSAVIPDPVPIHTYTVFPLVAVEP